MKKKPMKMTENRAIPRLVRNDAADPITEENTDTSNIFWISLKTVTSILKFSPSCGNEVLRKSLNSARGTAIPRTLFSMFNIDMSLTMPLTIGTVIVMTEASTPMTATSENAARSQSGAFLPLMLIFWSRVISGFAMSDMTTATRM